MAAIGSERLRLSYEITELSALESVRGVGAEGRSKNAAAEFISGTSFANDVPPPILNLDKPAESVRGRFFAFFG